MQEMIEAKNSAPARDIQIITAEINDIRNQAQRTVLLCAVEIGRRLVEAKSTLQHGQWGDWLKNEVKFSQSTAENYMRLFDEYGASQLSIFGALNSQTFENLSYSNAIQLLAVPRDEREAFAKEVGADELSTRELKAAIEERDRAKKEAEEAKAREKELAERLESVVLAEEKANTAIEQAEDLRAKLAQKEEEIAAERLSTEKAKAALKEAEKNPTIPKATLDKLRKEAEAAAKKEAEEASKKELEKLKAQVEKAKANEAAAKLEERLAQDRLKAAENKLKTASPEVTAFKALFDSMQDTSAKLRSMLDKIRTTDPETADKLQAALKAFGASLQ
ncbi:MAG: DUF3102 domain-containing protein [Clostridia bacterium]|nr:DUF3102 domain-containing protein [Clostridia bacterium]